MAAAATPGAASIEKADLLRQNGLVQEASRWNVQWQTVAEAKAKDRWE